MPSPTLPDAVPPSRHQSHGRALSHSQFLDYTGRELDRTRKCLGSRFDLLCLEPDCYMAAATAKGRDAAHALCSAAVDHLSTLLWPRDAIAALGDGRIAILLETQSVARTTDDFIDDIQHHLMSGFMADGREIRTTASIGFVRLSGSYHRASSVMDDAAAALARAKREGRARAAKFSYFVDGRLVEANELGGDISHALDRNELEVWFQPIVSAETGRLDAFEALLRWRHPATGLQDAGEFMQGLEAAGLMVATGEWMINSVAQESARWTGKTERTVPLTINLSVEQLKSDRVIGALVNAVSGSDDISLLVEVREEVVLADRDAIVPVLAYLRERGVRIVLEGIGTAVCCLEYLAGMPIDAIKLDATFADSVTRYSASSQSVTDQIVGLAHALELDVIGVRIERPDQLAHAASVCDEMQGYLISHPVDAATATAMVESDWTVVLAAPETLTAVS